MATNLEHIANLLQVEATPEFEEAITNAYGEIAEALGNNYVVYAPMLSSFYTEVTDKYGPEVHAFLASIHFFKLGWAIASVKNENKSPFTVGKFGD